MSHSWEKDNWQTGIHTETDRQQWFYRTFVGRGSNKAAEDIFGLSLAYGNYGEHLNFLKDQLGNKQSIISSSNIKIINFWVCNKAKWLKTIKTNLQRYWVEHTLVSWI